MKKLNNIQALRGVAVIAVIFFHLVIIEAKYGGTQTLLPSWLSFGMFGVDLFFVISGFVMVTITRGKFQQAREALMFLYHRASRIYPLYWVYTTLALIVFLIQPSWVNSSQGSQVDIFSSYLLLPSLKLPLVQVGWTLIYEMYYYLVFFVILFAVPEKFLVAAIFVWGGIIAIFSSPTGGPAYYIVFNPLTIEFLAGCLIAVHFHNARQVRVNGFVLVTIACLGMLAAILGYVQFMNLTGMYLEGWARLVYYGVPATIIVFCIVHAERNGTFLPNPLIQIGNASYSIYLSHLFTINAVGKVWNLFANDALFDNYIALCIAFILSLIAGFISYRFIELPLLSLSRKIA